MDDAAKSKRTSFLRQLPLRFSLRLFLLSVSVLGVLLGLYAKYYLRARNHRQIVAQIQDAGGKACYRVEGKDLITERIPKGPRFLRSLLGDEAFAEVEYVSFDQKKVTDADLKNLREIPGLKTVLTGGPGITERGVAFLADVPGLQALNIGNAGITAAGLQKLASARNLRELNLDGAGIDDEVVVGVRDLKNLRSLQLSRTSVTSEGLSAVDSLPALEGLDLLMSSAIGDAALEHLFSLQKLRYLNLGGTAITDDGLRRLRKLPNLQGLDLRYTNLTDDGMRYVGELLGLKELWLNAKIGDEGIAQLTRLPKLELLDLSGSKITDAAADDLMKFEYLFHLNLTYTQLSADCVKTLRSRLPSCRIYAPILTSNGKSNMRGQVSPDSGEPTLLPQ